MLFLSRLWATDACRLMVGSLVTALLLVLLPATAVRADELQDVAKLVKGGQLDDAERRADIYLKINPKDAQMRFLKGVILSQHGKRDDAVAVFTGLTQDFPELPEPYNNLAVIYASQNQFDKARGALESAIRTNPSYATAQENLGDVYARLASQAYSKALQLDQTNTAVQPKLAVIRTLFTPTPPGAKPSTTLVASAAPEAARPAPAPAPVAKAPAPVAKAPVPAPEAPAPAPAPAVKVAAAPAAAAAAPA